MDGYMEAEEIMQNVGFRFKGLVSWEKESVLKYGRKKGLTIFEMSKRLNTSPQLISYYMKKFGIK